MPVMKKWGIWFGVTAGAGALGTWLYPWETLASCVASFCIGVGFVLSCVCYSEVYFRHASATRAGDWLQELCSAWHFTHRGILLYSKAAAAPVLFLPWESICHVTSKDGAIWLEDEVNDSFYQLTVSAQEQESALERIRQQVEKHRHLHKEDEDISAPVFCARSPFSVPVLPFVKMGSPWLLAGIICPFIPGMEMGICCICFVLAAAVAVSGVSELDDDFCMEYYMGEELRRTKRGIIVRMNGGITCFLPWSSMGECIRLTEETVFLRLNGTHDGIICRGQEVPLPVTRHYGRWQRWSRRCISVGLALLSLVLGVVWWSVWA